MEGPPYMLSPSLHLGAISRLWGNQLLQNIEANTQSPDIHIFFQFWYHSIPSSLNFCQPPIQLFLVLWDHPLPAATPWHSIQLLQLFSFSRNLCFWQHCLCTPIPDTLGCPHDKSSDRHTVVGLESRLGGETAKFTKFHTTHHLIPYITLNHTPASLDHCTQHQEDPLGNALHQSQHPLQHPHHSVHPIPLHPHFHNSASPSMHTSPSGLS